MGANPVSTERSYLTQGEQHIYEGFPLSWLVRVS